MKTIFFVYGCTDRAGLVAIEYEPDVLDELGMICSKGAGYVLSHDTIKKLRLDICGDQTCDCRLMFRHAALEKDAVEYSLNFNQLLCELH